MTTYDEVMADIRKGRARGNGARNVRPNKFKNVRCEIEVDGKIERFDSKAERDRYLMLRMLERAGGITNLQRQITFKLKVNDEVICAMRWDFGYWDGPQPCVDDTKGAPPTADWLIKAKLFHAVNPAFERRINGVRMT
jgi:hypothetical protein